jgi:hypothetical protein
MIRVIDKPYKPEESIGEWGWLWHSPSGEWNLAFTFEHDDELFANLYVMGEACREPMACLRAQGQRNSRYLPLAAPACGPRAAVLVTARLPGGGTLSISHDDPGPEADASWNHIREAMIGHGGHD